MSKGMALELQQKNSQNIQQLQRLMMTRNMQQGLHLLQVPVMELSPLIEAEMEQNPVLEYVEEEEEENEKETPQEEEQQELAFEQDHNDILRQIDDDFYDYILENSGFVSKNTREDEKLHTFLESSVRAEETLFEHLMDQAKQTFTSQKEIDLAEEIIGNIDSMGFLKTSLEEIAMTSNQSIKEVEKILNEVQKFHPPGIGARDLKESLLIQLKSQNKESSLAYKIIETEFDDLLHNRTALLTKKLHCKSIDITKEIENVISKLDIHPGTSFSHKPISFITPDAHIIEEDQILKVNVEQESVPRLRLSRKYLQMLNDNSASKETKDFIKQKITSAKWLFKNVLLRNSTIQNIVEALAHVQKNFFLQPNGKLIPLTMKAVAEKLEVHESTIARAVANKYVNTPRGLFPLRFFFTSTLTSQSGENVSSNNVRDLIKDLIKKENKKKPLSDQAISNLIKVQGIKCARRTVAKYRTLMNFGTTQQRRKI